MTAPPPAVPVHARPIEGAVDHRPPLLRRAAASAALAAGALLLTACTENVDEYPHAGEPVDWADSMLWVVLVYVVLPLAVVALVSLLAVIPGARRRRRYRPQEGWDAEPVWFAGPADPVDAVQRAETGDVVRGGAGGSW